MTIDVTGVQDGEMARKLEEALRSRFSTRSDAEHWSVTIKSWTATVYKVVVQGRKLRREKLFFQGGDLLVDEILDWVALYLPPQGAVRSE